LAVILPISSQAATFCGAQARIDRLSLEQKELLQTLAVIGRESPRALIGKMTATAEVQLERTPAELRAAEFIHEYPALPETEYIFKHALT
jgi:hypothetical protein